MLEKLEKFGKFGKLKLGKLEKNCQRTNKKIQIYRSAISLIFPNFSQEFSKLSDFHVAK